MRVDGQPISCDLTYSLLGGGAAAQCPNNDCGPRTVTIRYNDGSERNVLARFDVNAYLEGYGYNGSGFIPPGYNYVGGGNFRAGGQTFNQYSPNSGLLTSSQWNAALNEEEPQAQPTPLSGGDLKKFQSERNRLLKLLSFIGDKGKSACRRYLEKLGFDVNKIRESLSQQIPYDAFKSLNDANEDFGHAGISVSEFFDFWKQDGGSFDGGAATGTTGRIYYSPKGIILSVILHETIHATNNGKGERKFYDPTNPRSDPGTGVVSFGAGSAPISDEELQDRFGIAKQSDSRNITTELEKNGCK